MHRIAAFGLTSLFVGLLLLTGSTQPGRAAPQGCTIIVNSLGDDTTNDELVTLREAISFATDADEPIGDENNQIEDCPGDDDDPGSDRPDSIVFDIGIFPVPPDAPATISLTNDLPPLDTGMDTIDGIDAGVIVFGNSRTCLNIHSAANTIAAIRIRDCSTAILIDAPMVVLDAGPQSGPPLGGNFILDNVIGFSDIGIHVVGNTSDNIIAGNFIGTEPEGTVADANDVGIRIEDSAMNTIGGTLGVSLPTASPAGIVDPQYRGNLISGNSSTAIEIVGEGATFNTVHGNYIGVDVSGLAVLPNGIGVMIQAADSNSIGSSDPGTGNVISGNNFEGVLLVSGASENEVQGNLIGVASDGTSALGNGGPGVRAASSGPNNIGGDSNDAGNVIAHNTGAGVEIEVVVMVSTNKFISRNSIHSNGGLGIDLNADGVTLNDNGDADGGANASQNYPLLTAAALNGGTHIEGTLNSTPNTGFELQFFANDECDPLDFGEGQTYLGLKLVTTDMGGNVVFSADVAAAAPGQQITATATDPADNTSEFSQCIAVSSPPTPTPSPTPSPTPAPGILGDTDCDLDVDPLDALWVLQDVAGFDPDVGCLHQGDVQCDEDRDATDALGILRHVAALPTIDQQPGCPAVGDPIV